ncbi:Uncharacterized conserved protein, contains HEPN domain [Saccharopolyspora antimicrobica]|uniref:Uncharacterized conserved protein, contains HEPN domain n=1 Tax=Saccharopolyspora antimicrobica TaxID=455193 RepID=A0A1I5HHM0_9PSEU|nr:DUF86 domain-containing protein [Saccharopolyspora antimicrobica]RKT85292.1 uncharacterized protein with HEPN domain [Saccharopolyspora antimicrobica]SFO47743.1 Uncharacterized conserved protein, contains HEPN domain [Saccharopolyspora antimicrobica]
MLVLACGTPSTPQSWLDEFSKGEDFADYQANATFGSAVERHFEIIGEALNQLSRVDSDIASRIPDLGRIVAFRNILIHGYATVDDALVWQVLTERLPGLTAALQRLLSRRRSCQRFW